MVPSKYFRPLCFFLFVTATAVPDSEPIVIHPGESIQDAVNNAPEGARFLLKAGVHRLQQIRPKHGQIFEGEQGAILSGAALLTTFDREGNFWVATGQYQRGQVHGQCHPSSPGCRYPEDLFIDDVPLIHVRSRSQLAPGRWFFDYDNHKIYLADDPTGKRVETSVTRHAFSGTARDVTIRGLIIEKYASPAQYGAIHPRVGNEVGTGWRIEGNAIRWNHGCGIRIADGMYIGRNYVVGNGQMGIGDIGNDVVVEDNEIAWNNYAGYAAEWEAGGAKFVKTNRLVVRRNYVHNNRGTGLWTDIDNINTIYEFNHVVDNWGPGIQHEISYDAVIRHNYLRGNGRGGDAWVWGSQILVQNSQNVEVHDNYVEVNEDYGDGIFLVYQRRGSGRYGPYITVNNWVHHNEVVFKGNAGTTGAAADFDHETLYSGNNRFNNNGYRVPRTDMNKWEWRGVRNWIGFQSQGQDVAGWALSHRDYAILTNQEEGQK